MKLRYVCSKSLLVHGNPYACIMSSRLRLFLAQPQNVSQVPKTGRCHPGWERSEGGLADLAVEQAGFVPGPIKSDVLLVHRFVPVHTVLVAVSPQSMVPPIEHRKPFRVVHRVAGLAAGLLAPEAAADVIHRSRP